MLTQAELKQLLTYDADTGQFTRLVSATRKDRVGKIAGTVNMNGYRNIKLGKNVYKAHRLAWLYVYGEWPENLIDHINGVLDDNRIENLRSVTHKQNMENQTLHVNNTSGHRGVIWKSSEQKWMARLTHHGKRVTIGRFSTLEEAAAAAKAMRDQLFTHNKTEYAA